MVKCKFPDKECRNRNWYISHNEHHAGKHCRLFEWKQRLAVCPYDDKIFSPHKIAKQIKSGRQKIL